MITSIVSILVSISILNTGFVDTTSVSELQIPDARFAEEVQLESDTTFSGTSFSYFVDVQLPQIQERTITENQRLAELERAANEAKQKELARIEEERIRIEAEIQRIANEKAEAERRAIQAAQQAQSQNAAAAEAVPTPVNTDYETMIRNQCAAVGCNPEQLIRVMYCESGGRHNAYNKSSGASGLFQHLPQYWANRAATYGVPGASIWDPQAQVIVSAGMFSQGLAHHWVCK